METVANNGMRRPSGASVSKRSGPARGQLSATMQGHLAADLSSRPPPGFFSSLPTPHRPAPSSPATAPAVAGSTPSLQLAQDCEINRRDRPKFIAALTRLLRGIPEERREGFLAGVKELFMP